MPGDAAAPESAPIPRAAGTAPQLPRFQTEHYLADSPSAVGRTLLLVIGVAAAGFLVGLLVSVVARWVYLAVVFPVVMGGITGGVGSALVKATKVRGRLAIGLAGVLAGVAAPAGVLFGDYLRVLNVFERQVPGVRAKSLSDPRYFFQFVDRQAEGGVTLGRSAWQGPGRGVNLGYVGSYLYWAGETVLIGFVVFAVLRAAATAPWCERCRRWKKEQPLGTLPLQSPDGVLGPLRDGRLLDVLATSAATESYGLLLTAAACPPCGPAAPVDVAVALRTRNAKGQVQYKILGRVRYPGEVLPLLDARRGPA